MRMTDLSPRILEFSTDGVPEHDRTTIWREHYGNVMLRVDIEPAPGYVFEARNRCLSLPGLQLMEGASSPVRISRHGRFLADGNDDVILAINRAGSVTINSGGKEQSLRDGEAMVLSAGDPPSLHHPSHGRSSPLRVPRMMFKSPVVSFDDALRGITPADLGALK